jgi:DDB1- and CUL4-associated factor 7
MLGLVVTSSIDRMFMDWNLDTSTVVTQWIAHDREVYDVDDCPTRRNSQASRLSVDGSLRAFDLRSLEYRCRTAA